MQTEHHGIISTLIIAAFSCKRAITLANEDFLQNDVLKSLHLIPSS